MDLPQPPCSGEEAMGQSTFATDPEVCCASVVPLAGAWPCRLGNQRHPGLMSATSFLCVLLATELE